MVEHFREKDRIRTGPGQNGEISLYLPVIISSAPLPVGNPTCHGHHIPLQSESLSYALCLLSYDCSPLQGPCPQESPLLCISVPLQLELGLTVNPQKLNRCRNTGPFSFQQCDKAVSQASYQEKTHEGAGPSS